MENILQKNDNVTTNNVVLETKNSNALKDFHNKYIEAYEQAYEALYRKQKISIEL